LRNLLERRAYIQPKVALVAVCKDWPFCQDPQQPQDIPRVMEMAKKFGLEFLRRPAREPHQELF